MLDRVSVAVSLTTIMAILGKLALLYNETGTTWFGQGVSDEAMYFLLMSCFLIFFRGKMMHDDSGFFKDIFSDKFKKDTHSKFLIKSGIISGYFSWLCWAPAIYFLEKSSISAWWLVGSLAISTIWLVIDIMTRKVTDEDEQAKKRPIWILVNIIYAAPLVLIGVGVTWVSPQVLAGALVLILFVDWLMTDVEYVA